MRSREQLPLGRTCLERVLMESSLPRSPGCLPWAPPPQIPPSLWNENHFLFPLGLLAEAKAPQTQSYLWNVCKHEFNGTLFAPLSWRR